MKIVYVFVLLWMGYGQARHCQHSISYMGDAVECGPGPEVPFRVEIPKIDPKVHVPKEYGYQVCVPPSQLNEGAARNYDYQVEVPSVKQHQYNPNQQLTACVDKIVLQRTDSEVMQPYTSYQPKIDILKSCPLRGHLYPCQQEDNSDEADRFKRDTKQGAEKGKSTAVKKPIYPNPANNGKPGSTNNAKNRKIRTICPTIKNLQNNINVELLHRPDVIQYLPEIDPYRESQTNQLPQPYLSCKSITQNSNYVHHNPSTNSRAAQCVSIYSRPQFIVNHHGEWIPFIPGQQKMLNNHLLETPRFVYDQLGHKYVEHNGNLRLIKPHQTINYQRSQNNPIVGDARYSVPSDEFYFDVIEDSLNSNPDFKALSNLEPGQMAENPIKQAVDFITLLRDLTNY